MKSKLSKLKEKSLKLMTKLRKLKFKGKKGKLYLKD